MPVNLKVTLGTVNYLDYIHVTASKVSNPNTAVYNRWIDVPVANFNFVIPNLDPENYYIRYYDAPTDSSLGTLVAELLVNALTGEWMWERRFYRCGGTSDVDPAQDSTHIIDPYLVGKTIYGVFKEGFRYYIPTEEFTFDDTAGDISLLSAGSALNNGEVISVEIKYNVGSSQSSGVNGLYQSTITVLEASRTLLAVEVGSRVRLKGSATSQVITLPPLSVIGADKGFYFDHSVKQYPGGPLQVKILPDGGDMVHYTGFCGKNNNAPYLFPEFWVSNGGHLLLRKTHDDEDNADYWEVILEDCGTAHVGEKLSGMYRDHPNTLAWDGSLYDGDELPRIWYWLKNILPATHKYQSANVVSGSYLDNTKRGQFAIHPTLKKFRTPTGFSLSEKGLLNYTAVADPDRAVNYPGGFQPEAVGTFNAQTMIIDKIDSSTSAGGSPGYGRIAGGSDGTEPAGFVLHNVAVLTGKKQIVDNFGVVHLTRI